VRELREYSEMKEMKVETVDTDLQSPDLDNVVRCTLQCTL